MQWNCPHPPALLNCVSVRKDLNVNPQDWWFDVSALIRFLAFYNIQYWLDEKDLALFVTYLAWYTSPTRPHAASWLCLLPWLSWTLCSPLAYKMSLTKSLLRSALEVHSRDWGPPSFRNEVKPCPCHLFCNILGFFIIFPLKNTFLPLNKSLMVAISTSLKKVFSDLPRALCPLCNFSLAVSLNSLMPSPFRHFQAAQNLSFRGQIKWAEC